MSDEKDGTPKQTPRQIVFRSTSFQTLFAASRQGTKNVPKTVAVAPRVQKSALKSESPASSSVSPSVTIKKEEKLTFEPKASRPSSSSSSVQHGRDSTRTVNMFNALAQSLSVSKPSAKTDGFKTPGFGSGGGMRRSVSSAAQLDIQRKMAAAQKAGKRKTGSKSRDLLELSWPAKSASAGEIAMSYTPISLPFVVRDGDENEEGTSQRPSIKRVDDANRVSAGLFIGDTTSDDSAPWILVQFPSLLPALDRRAMELQTKRNQLELLNDEDRINAERELASDEQAEVGNWDNQYVPSSIDGLPEGKLGKLLIRKSGRVQLKLGVHLCDVNLGNDCDFAQEVGCYLPDNSEFIFLGKCLHKMVVTPDIHRTTQQQATRTS